MGAEPGAWGEADANLANLFKEGQAGTPEWYHAVAARDALAGSNPANIARSRSGRIGRAEEAYLDEMEGDDGDPFRENPFAQPQRLTAGDRAAAMFGGSIGIPFTDIGVSGRGGQPQYGLESMYHVGANDPWLTGGTDYLKLTQAGPRDRVSREVALPPGMRGPQTLAPDYRPSAGLPTVEDIGQRADAVINGDGPPAQLAVTDFILPAIGRLLGGQPPTPTPAPPPGQQRLEPAFPYESSSFNPFRDLRGKYGPDPRPEFGPFNIPLFEGGDEWTLANELDALEDEAAAEAAQRAEEAAQREADLDYYYDEMAGEYG